MKTALGMIVLDGFPILPYVVEAARSAVDKIVIVEGAVPAARRTCTRDDGFMSHDGTAEYLTKLAEDPKVTVVVAGNQPEKTDMWNLYIDEMQDCDYVLNLDSDEVVSSATDIKGAFSFMEENRDIDRLDLPVTQFFLDFDHTVHGGIWDHPFRRLWRLRPGAKFQAHRPPYMVKDEKFALLPGLRLYHYSWIGVERAKNKSAFYQRLRPDHPQYGRHMDWFHHVYMLAHKNKKFRGFVGDFGLHVSQSNPESEIHRFEGQHPTPIAAAIKSGKLKIGDI